MYKKLILSVTTLVAVVSLGISATYALFTSNSVTIAASSIQTGSAEIKICSVITDASDWTTIISPTLSLEGMIPGGAEKELTEGETIYVGNDDGTLNDNHGTDCDSGSTGSSDVNLKLVPKIENLVCPGALPTDLLLRFVIGGIDSGYGTMAFWQTNTIQYGSQFNPGQDGQVQIFSQLSSGATQQGDVCTFDLTFTGGQV